MPRRKPRETTRREPAAPAEVPFADRPAASPSGRQREPADVRSPDEMPEAPAEEGEAMPGELEPDEQWKSVRDRPAAEDVMDETSEGLDPVEETVRRQAEDRPVGPNTRRDDE